MFIRCFCPLSPHRLPLCRYQRRTKVCRLVRYPNLIQMRKFVFLVSNSCALRLSSVRLHSPLISSAGHLRTKDFLPSSLIRSNLLIQLYVRLEKNLESRSEYYYFFDSLMLTLPIFPSLVSAREFICVRNGGQNAFRALFGGKNLALRNFSRSSHFIMLCMHKNRIFVLLFPPRIEPSLSRSLAPFFSQHQKD